MARATSPNKVPVVQIQQVNKKKKTRDYEWMTRKNIDVTLPTTKCAKTTTNIERHTKYLPQFIMRSICTDLSLPEDAVGVAFFGEPESVTSCIANTRRLSKRFTKEEPKVESVKSFKLIFSLSIHATQKNRTLHTFTEPHSIIYAKSLGSPFL